jgi:hypothetical protein
VSSRAAVALIALGGALLGAESAQACSCAYIPPKQQLRAADGAVVARLVALRPDEPPEADGDLQPVGWAADYVYRIGRVLKRGPGLRRGRRLVIRSYTDGCGLPDRKRVRYGLFLDRRRGRWEASLCSVVSPAQMRRAAGDAGAAGGGAERTGC